MGGASRLTLAALVTSVLALAWAAVLSFRSPPPCACPSPSASATHAALTPPATGGTAASLRVAALERRLQRLEVIQADGSAPPPMPTDPALPDDTAAERFVSLKSPSPSVKVEELENGAFAAHNDDPKLTGKTLVVEGRRADGSVEKISIAVPAPEK